MSRNFHLKFAVTGEARGEIAGTIAVAFYKSLRGTSNKLSCIIGSSDSDLGGTAAPLSVAQKKYDLAFANPASLGRMAFRGRGFYRRKLPLRAIGVFPSWDRLVFAIHPRTGIRSLEELKEKRYPLRVSTRTGGKFHSTLYAVDETLRAYGFGFADIEKWGGKVFRAASPSSKERKLQLARGRLDAVFDEGIKSWGDDALRAGMKFLPLGERVLRRLEGIGYSRAAITPGHFPKVKQRIDAVDFSGWLLFCHRDLPDSLAYEIAANIDAAGADIPVDHFDGRAMTMREFCRGGEGGPLGIPLHPGARRYFKRKGYL